MTSACFSRGHTGFSRNATLVAKVNPSTLAGGVFNVNLSNAGKEEEKEVYKTKIQEKLSKQMYYSELSFTSNRVVARSA